jgi:2-dehydro-3-deoxyglucarate aldolase/4-hydroxy-2-oxoheptanedioate aldolase
MQRNTIKHKLAAGGWVLGSCVTDYVGAEVVTVLKAAGLEHFFLDTEHGRPSFSDIQTLVRVGRAADVIPLVRVTDTEYPLIARTLDCGAMGIVAPRIASVAQAQKVVDCMKFPPLGRRGYGLRSIITDLNFTGAQAEMESSNNETMVILQMETKEFVEDVEKITAIPGVDATMVGPFDLSVSLGIPGDFENAKFWSAFDRMVEACNKNGVAPGVHAGSVEMLEKCKEHGARFLVCGTDVSVLLRGWKAIRAAFPAGDEQQAGSAGYM